MGGYEIIGASRSQAVVGMPLHRFTATGHDSCDEAVKHPAALATRVKAGSCFMARDALLTSAL
jgi:hypothetical protein